MTRDNSRHYLVYAGAFALAASIGDVARAAAFNDPAGDFIPSYVGPRNPDLDTRTVEGIYDGVNFTITTTSGGPIGQTPGGVFVWGFQRGQGTPRFAAIAPGVLFDSVLSVTPGGVTTVRDLITGVGTNLPAGATTISGNTVTIVVPASLLPSMGLTPGSFLLNLWPRSGSANNNQIADFAPDNSSIPFTLAFPAPLTAGVQTDLAVDNASFAFERLATRLAVQRDAATKGGAFVTIGGRAGGSGLSNGLQERTTTGDITAGLDFGYGPFLIGVAAATGSGTVDLTHDGELKSDSASGYGYAGWSRGPAYILAFGGYTSLEFKSRRPIAIGQSVYYGYASPKGWAISYGGRAGFQAGTEKFGYGPVLDVVQTRATIKRYTEVGAGDFGVTVGRRRRESVRIGLGLNFTHNRPTDYGAMQVHATARVVREFGERNDDIAFSFTPQPGVILSAATPRLTRTYGVIDVGMDFKFRNNAVAGLSFVPRIDKNGLVDGAGFVTARMGF